jgi:hypothetical protein
MTVESRVGNGNRCHVLGSRMLILRKLFPATKFMSLYYNSFNLICAGHFPGLFFRSGASIKFSKAISTPGIEYNTLQ